MAVKPPTFDGLRKRPQTGFNVLDGEIMAEIAASIGRCGRAFEKALAALHRQPDATPVPLEHGGSEQRLQFLDLHAGGRLGAVDPRRAAQETAGVIDGQKGPQQVSVQVLHDQDIKKTDI